MRTNLQSKKCPSTMCEFRAKRTGWCTATPSDRAIKHCPVDGVSGYFESEKYTFSVNRKR